MDKKRENGITTLYFFGNYEEENQGGTLTKTVKYYFINGQRVAERSSTTGLRYYHHDHLSSTTVITDASGNLILRTVPDPYGSDAYSQGSAVIKYKYTDQEKDGSGLYYYGARYYDPELGRFLSPDTVLDGLNRYTYCGNNPIVYIDPTGNFAWTWSVSSNGVQLGINFGFFGFGINIGFGDYSSIGAYIELGPRVGENGATLQLGYNYYINQGYGSWFWGLNVSYHSAAYAPVADFDWRKFDNDMLALTSSPLYHYDYYYGYDYSYLDFPIAGYGCGFDPGVTATAGTMWWLCVIDGPLPVGDIIYGSLITASAIYQYGPMLIEFGAKGGQAANSGGSSGGSSGSNLDPKNIYKSIKQSPNYPDGFKAVQNGTKNYNVNNRALLEKLREIEPGKWEKVYKDGFDAAGNKVSIHYFQSPSGQVFDVAVKLGWSNY